MAQFLSFHQHKEGECASCRKHLIDTLLYRYTQRTYIDTFEGMPIVVAYTYFVCMNCLERLIYSKREASNG